MDAASYDSVLRLLEDERAELLKLLGALDPEAWAGKTACPGWSVKDIVAHVLGDDYGILARERDGFRAPDSPRSSSWDDVVRFVNERNEIWVAAWRRCSPRLLIDLLGMSGPALRDHYRSLDADALGPPVSWAGDQPAPHWLRMAREYTERWVHQQQIRDATGRPGLREDRWVRPLLDTFAHSLPVALRDAEAPDATAVVLEATGEGWSLGRRPSWRTLATRDPAQPATCLRGRDRRCGDAVAALHKGDRSGRGSSPGACRRRRGAGKPHPLGQGHHRLSRGMGHRAAARRFTMPIRPARQERSRGVRMRFVRFVVMAALAVVAIGLLPVIYIVVDRSLAAGTLRADALGGFGSVVLGVGVVLIAAAIVVLLWLRGDVRRAGETQATAQQRLRWEELVRATPILRVTFGGWNTVAGKVVAVFEIENPSPQPVLEISLVVRGRDDRRAAPSANSAETSLAMVPNLGSSQATIDLSAFRTATPATSEGTAGRDIFTYPWLQVMVAYRALLGQKVEEEYSVWIDRPVEATEVWHFEHLRVEPAVQGFEPLDIAF